MLLRGPSSVGGITSPHVGASMNKWKMENLSNKINAVKTCDRSVKKDITLFGPSKTTLLCNLNLVCGLHSRGGGECKLRLV